MQEVRYVRAWPPSNLVPSLFLFRTHARAHVHTFTHSHAYTYILCNPPPAPLLLVFASLRSRLSFTLFSLSCLLQPPIRHAPCTLSPCKERRRSTAPRYEGVSRAANPAYAATSANQPPVIVLVPRSTKIRLRGGDKVARLSSLPLGTSLGRQYHSERVAKMIGTLIAQIANSYRRFVRSNSFAVIPCAVILDTLGIAVGAKEKTDVLA